MAKLYRISCREAGVDCDFTAEGSSLEEVLQLCADHGVAEHDVKGSAQVLYAKMRNCVRVVDDGTADN